MALGVGPASADAVNRSVARRTARRMAHRTTARATAGAAYDRGPRIDPALPGGCVQVRIDNVVAWHCGGLCDRAASGGDVNFTP